MLSVSKVLPQGHGLSAVLVRRAPSVELDWDVRQKSRFDATDSQGRTLGVFLPRGSVVRGGDVLVAEDGSMIRVVARPQPVMVVRTCTEHGSPFDLLRAAYHLGNRHVALQLEHDHLKLEPDHVLAALLRRMHLIVDEANEAFEPEGGAYAGGGHGPEDHQGHHDHDHDHGHDHGHGHDHDDGRAHDHGQAHAHDGGHGHAHHGPGHDHAVSSTQEHVHGQAEADPREHGQAHGETREPGAGERPDGG